MEDVDEGDVVDVSIVVHFSQATWSGEDPCSPSAKREIGSARNVVATQLLIILGKHNRPISAFAQPLHCQTIFFSSILQPGNEIAQTSPQIFHLQALNKPYQVLETTKKTSETFGTVRVGDCSEQTR